MVGRRVGRALAAALAVVTLVAAGGPPAGGTGAAGRAGAAQQAPITVTRLLGPDGEAMDSASHVTERGLVVGTVPGPGGFYNPPVAAVWQRGTARTIGAAHVETVISDVSDRGQVVGTLNGMLTFTPFSWRDGEHQQLPPAINTDPANPRVLVSFARSVDERGRVLGTRTDWADPDVPRIDTVVWAHSEVVAVAPGVSIPEDLNDRGEAAVTVYPSGGPEPVDGVAAVWRVGGGMRRLGTMGGEQSWGLAIDERGRVAGVSETASGDRHAFAWRGGRMVDLGTLGGATSVVGDVLTPGGLFQANVADLAINDRGDIVGTSETASGDLHAFLWRDGRMADLGTLGGATSRATAVNDRGQVVGYSETADGATHAFLWDRGRMTDLGALLGTTPAGDPVQSRANDVNDRGQVVGAATGGAVLWQLPRR
jgi:probable HAF family extracellular repeat protein